MTVLQPFLEFDAEVLADFLGLTDHDVSIVGAEFVSDGMTKPRVLLTLHADHLRGGRHLGIQQVLENGRTILKELREAQ